jgi:tryptophan-rich sensory protein
MDSLYYGRLFAPIATGFGIAAITPSMKNRGSRLKQTPPGWVFSVVWTALYLGLGYTWAESAEREPVRADIAFGILTALLALWLLAVAGWLTREKPGVNRASLYIMILAVIATINGLQLATDELATVSMSSLLGWLLFAQHLNFHSIR